MIFYTSFSPSEESKRRQLKALRSWKLLKVPIVSLNSKEEIEILKRIYTGVDFVSTTRTSEYLFGKPQVKINALIDYATSRNVSKDICLINSDIEVKELPEVKGGLTIVSRYNYIKEHNDAELEPWGIDMFIFNSYYSYVVPQRVYTMGQPCWDYWLPLCFMKAKLPIYQIVTPISFHQKHKGNWNDDTWNLTWKLLCDEKMVKGKTSIDVCNKINRYAVMDKPILRERLMRKMKREEDRIKRNAKKKPTKINIKKEEGMEELIVVGSGKKFQRSVNKLLKEGWNIKVMNPRRQPIFSSNDIENMTEVLKAVAESKPVEIKMKQNTSIQNACLNYEYIEVVLFKE